LFLSRSEDMAHVHSYKCFPDAGLEAAVAVRHDHITEP